MICLRCGYCCISYVVGIIDDESAEGASAKPGGERCKHLRGSVPGEMSCALHNDPRYAETPCFDYGQVEASPDCPCRMGEFNLSDPRAKVRIRELIIQTLTPEGVTP